MRIFILSVFLIAAGWFATYAYGVRDKSWSVAAEVTIKEKDKIIADLRRTSNEDRDKNEHRLNEMRRMLVALIPEKIDQIEKIFNSPPPPVEKVTATVPPTEVK